VKSENLFILIPDLGKYIKEKNGNSFVYNVYITSRFLDAKVNSERTNFNIPNKQKKDEISYKQIRNEIIQILENLLSDFLRKNREKKVDKYKKHIFDNSPQFRELLKYKSESIDKMPPELSGNKLDIELFKIQNNFEIEIKERGEEILNPKKDITNLKDYKKNYNNYIEKFNAIGKASLAKYIVHRKAVIELLDKFLNAFR